MYLVSIYQANNISLSFMDIWGHVTIVVECINSDDVKKVWLGFELCQLQLSLNMSQHFCWVGWQLVPYLGWENSFYLEMPMLKSLWQIFYWKLILFLLMPCILNGKHDSFEILRNFIDTTVTNTVKLCIYLWSFWSTGLYFVSQEETGKNNFCKFFSVIH